MNLDPDFPVDAMARGISLEARVRMNQVLSQAIGAQGLVRGQYEDLHEASTFRPEHEIAGTSDLKTASLFRASVQIGALAAGAGEPVVSTLETFASELGQAFQLFDDLNDNNPHTGKDRGQDQGKVTLLTLLGEQGACERLAIHLQKADRLLGRVYGPDQAVRCYVKSLFTCLEAGLPTGVGGRRALAKGPGVAV